MKTGKVILLFFIIGLAIALFWDKSGCSNPPPKTNKEQIIATFNEWEDASIKKRIDIMETLCLPEGEYHNILKTIKLTQKGAWVIFNFRDLQVIKIDTGKAEVKGVVSFTQNNQPQTFLFTSTLKYVNGKWKLYRLITYGKIQTR